MALSRQIDLSQKLSDEDRQYLLDHGREYDIALSDGMTQDQPTVTHTGDVSPIPETATEGGIRSTDGAVPSGPATDAAAAGMPGIVAADGSLPEGGQEPSTAPAPLEAPYDREGVTKKMLIAEIDRRNALPENAEYEPISKAGDKDALVAALNEDDEASS